MDTSLWIASGIWQFVLSCTLGWLMLVPRQPWGRALAGLIRNRKMLVATHLDLLMLGMLQVCLGAAGLQLELELPSWVIVAMASGAWFNALPYLVSAVSRLDPFVLAGSPAQMAVSSVCAASSISLTAALLYTALHL